MMSCSSRWRGRGLRFSPRDKLAEDAGISDDGGIPNDGLGFSGITLAHNAPSKEAVDRVFATALAAGARAVKRPQDVFWGGYSGYFADPDGHLWEVAFNPLMDLT